MRYFWTPSTTATSPCAATMLSPRRPTSPRYSSRGEVPRDTCLHQFDDQRHGGFGIVRWHKIEVALALGPGEVGNGAPVDLVRAGDDPAVGGLAKDLGQAHDRHRAGRDDVGQDLTRADGGELVEVADDQQRGMVGDGPQ